MHLISNRGFDFHSIRSDVIVVAPFAVVKLGIEFNFVDGAFVCIAGRT